MIDTTNIMEGLKNLLEAIAQGTISPEIGLEKLKYVGFESVGGFAHIDHHRVLRTGFPEVIWGLGKTSAQITEIMTAMLNKTPDHIIMATRIESNIFEELTLAIPNLTYYPLAKICAIIPPNHQLKSSSIMVISAGTTDIPIGEEAAVTLELFGWKVQRLWDVGVAGIHRLLNHIDWLKKADVLIVVAGMDGALPSVVGGLVDCPVIAVPTSIGYGANFGGVAPLLTMLNSCASGIGVVNIDNGFGAAVLASRILSKINHNITT